jgi:hypothetical protein
VFFHGGLPRALNEEQDEWLRMTRAPSTSGGSSSATAVTAVMLLVAILVLSLLT